MASICAFVSTWRLRCLAVRSGQSANRGARFSAAAAIASGRSGPASSCSCSRDSASSSASAPASCDRPNSRLALRTARGLRRGDLAGQFHRRQVRVVRHPGRDPQRDRLGPGELAGGVGQLAGHVVADEPAQQRDARHVGHQPPARLHHRELGVGGRRSGCRPRARSAGRRRTRRRGWRRSPAPAASASPRPRSGTRWRCRRPGRRARRTTGRCPPSRPGRGRRRTPGRCPTAPPPARHPAWRARPTPRSARGTCRGRGR